jgi:arylsulfatase A-like enzyme/thioredoxin-like negative regulator of GroEL
VIALATAVACSGPAPGVPPAQSATAQPTTARHLVLVTIDTLRADRVGAYGYTRARTPAIDALARRGARFERAYATAPITLPSHASLMTGRYPPGHGARHNGVHVDSGVPTLATTLSAAGFATGAFITAFPLDKRFGLDAGFDVYGDRLPRTSDGRPGNERPGREAVDEAVAWLASARSSSRRLFLWLHLFDPHAPYGQPASSRSIADRYDDEVAESDAQIARLLEAMGPEASSALVVVASDHGEAFGEHGEMTHSLFVYDTTLRVPLVLAGPGVAARTIDAPVSLVDVAPTVLPLLGLPAFDADGINLAPALSGSGSSARDLYAESFAPLLDFGWAPLRSIRAGAIKYIDAPRPELYDTAADPGEEHELSSSQTARVGELRDRVARYSDAAIDPSRLSSTDREARARLQSLGYASGSTRAAGGARPDPKDRRALAARLSEIASGELSGPALEAALAAVLAEDPRNPQANLRLGYVLLESDRCPAAVPLLSRAIAAQLPSADAHLGLALCQIAARQPGQAETTLRYALRVEPDSPVVLANLGMLLSDLGRHREGIDRLQRAVTIDPQFHQARFNLARVYARDGQRVPAAREAQDLLARLPAGAPQRAEVQRLLDAVR